MTEFAPG